jgi:hypothetical protein
VSVGWELGALQFALTAGDGVAIQASDPRQQRNPAATVLLSQEAGEQASRPFVGGNQETVDVAMLPCGRAAGMELASRAGAAMKGVRGMASCHEIEPPER